MEKRFGSIVLVILLLGLIYFFKDSVINYKESLESPLEKFIWLDMVNEKGLLRTNYKESEGDNYTLSESLGLSMVYAIQSNNLELFDECYRLLNTYFKSNDGHINWRLRLNGQPTERVNAFLDDIRIVASLLDANDKWNKPKYKKTAKQIFRELRKNSVINDRFVDFYDKEYELANSSFTLTYLDLVTLRRLQKEGWLEERIVSNMELVAEMATAEQTSFFYKTYEVETNTLHYEKIVNMSEQVYTAYHLAKAGYPTGSFLQLLKEEWAKYGKLYGQYDTEKQIPIVEYESPALYGMALLYVLEIEEYLFAGELYKRMLEFKVKDGRFMGVYMDMGKLDTHIFDNLVPLIAERSYLDAEANSKK